ncbi:right-handed parallel beta-helix repeat-containing protein [Kribbella qitaiheensis]|nr:right-handed parallel beta-helix repeat-containing protein [Kribbella qitaiheensis]
MQVRKQRRLLAFAISTALALPVAAAVTATTAQAVDCVGVSIPLTGNIQTTINANPAGTTYCLAAGVYKLSSPISLKTGDTLWGVGPSPTTGTMLSGAQVMTGWVASGSNWYVNGVLPPDYGSNTTGIQCEDNVLNQCWRKEDIFRGSSTQLVRVGSIADLAPGKFYADYAANRVYVRDNPTTTTMQISRASSAIASGTTTDVTVRGLGVRYFANQSQSGAVQLGTRWNVFSVSIAYNHAAGFKFEQGDGASLSASGVSYNGQLGGAVYRATNFSVTDVEVHHNNPQANYQVYDWESGGIKVSTHSTGVLDTVTTHDNLGVGLWADSYAGSSATTSGLEMRDSAITNNSADGIRFEISSNGYIHGSTITGNGCDLLGRRGAGVGGLFDGAGIDVNTANTVEITGNTVSGNFNAIGGQHRKDRTLEDNVTPIYLTGLNVHDNTVTSTRCANGYGLGLTGVVTNDKAGHPQTYTTDNNRFVSNDYKIPAADGGLTAVRYSWAGSNSHKWATWTSPTGDNQDAGGTAVAIP